MLDLIKQVNDDGRVEDAVYTTLNNPYDNDKDFLFLNDAHLLSIKPIELCLANISHTKEKAMMKIDLSFKYDKDDEFNMQLIASEDGREYARSSIELQTFVDGICYARYKDIPYTDEDSIAEAIKNIVKPLSESLFNNDGKLLVCTKYSFAGIAFNLNNEKVGFINKFDVQDYSESEINIKLLEVVSYMSFDDLDVNRIEFYSKNKKFIVDNFSINEKSEGTIKQYLISAKSYSIEDNNEEVETYQIDDEDVLFDTASKHLVSVKNLINDEDRFDSYFDDFDW